MHAVNWAFTRYVLKRSAETSLNSTCGTADVAAARIGIRNPIKALEWSAEGLELSPLDPVFLINSTVAAAEAGRATLAFETLDLLAKHHPSTPELNLLASTLARWRQEDLPPLVLCERISRHPSLGLITCSACAAHISVADEQPMLCAGCGALLIGRIGPCDFCESMGKVAPAFMNSFACPYCNRGGLRFTGRS